ncbi:MAG: glycosyl transferase [Candidatus Syntrophosphaera sp.]|nr:glycosyl transferase [Candidatus Syntrophosphaera sp.]
MRLLLITYYFPPCGGASVQRWLKWLPDLVQRGFEVTVLTTRSGDYPYLDDSLLAEIPPEVKVLRSHAPSSGKIWKLLMGRNSSLPHGNLGSMKNAGLRHKIIVWLRLNLVIPDLRKAWNPSAYKTAVEHLRHNPTDIVITTGPPHSTHLLGLKLKQRHKLRWVADWRDPWTSIYYLKLNPPSALSMRIHRHLERKVALGADLNTVVSEYLAKQLPSVNSSVVYNGFDARKFDSLRDQTFGNENGTTFRLKYVGNITEGQEIGLLIRMIAEALQGERYQLVFIGTRLSDEQRELLRDLMPGSHLARDFVPHQEALAEMVDSEVLLLLINYYEGSEGMLTTKLFEYLASGTKIFCLGPKGGEAEKLILGYDAGAFLDAEDTKNGQDYLRKLFKAWERKEDIENHRDVSALSSQNQALKLIKQLEGIKRG